MTRAAAELARRVAVEAPTLGESRAGLRRIPDVPPLAIVSEFDPAARNRVRRPGLGVPLTPRTLRLLAVNGSLRAASATGTVLAAAARLAPAGVEVVPFAGLAALPHFNPDDDAGPGHPAVAAWRAAVRGAAGVAVASPEYAHGIPGVLKNALDWLVGSGEFAGKPVAVWNPSPRSVHAAAQLREVLATMAAVVVDGACVTLPVAGRNMDAAAITTDPTLAGPVAAALAELTRAAGG